MNENFINQSSSESNKQTFLNEINANEININKKQKQKNVSSKMSMSSRDESFQKYQQFIEINQSQQSRQSPQFQQYSQLDQQPQLLMNQYIQQHQQQVFQQMFDDNIERLVQQEFQSIRDEIKQIQDENVQIKSVMGIRDEKIRILGSLCLKQGIAIEKMRSFVQFKNFSDHEKEINALRYLFQQELDQKALFPNIEAQIFIEKLIAQSISKFEKKLDDISDMNVKVQSLNTKNDNHFNKIKAIENQILLISHDINDRIKKQEFQDQFQNLSLQQKQLSNMFNLLADKESVQGIIERIYNVEKQQNMFVYRYEYEKQMTELKDQIELSNEQLYLKKQIFQIEMKKQQNALNDFINEQSQRHTKITNNEEKVAIQISDIQRKFESKVDQTVFNKFKEWCNYFVHKDDIDDIYSKILPAVSQVELKSKQCEECVEKFKLFLKQTDEAILFKATRMDLEILQKEIYNNFITFNEHKEQLQLFKNQMEQNIQDVQKYVDSNKQSMQQNVREMIHDDIVEDLQLEVSKYFQKLQIFKIESALAKINDALIKKAEASDLMQLDEQKTHKSNTEKIAQFVIMMHKQFKQMNYSCLQFMRTFLSSSDLESFNSKQSDMNKSVNQMEQLFIQANSQSFQRYFKQSEANISPTIKNFSSLKLQDSSFEPQLFSQTISNSHINDSMPNKKIPNSNKTYQFVNTSHNYFPNSINKSTSPLNRSSVKNNQEDSFVRNQTPQSISKRYTLQNKYAKIKLNQMKPLININTKNKFLDNDLSSKKSEGFDLSKGFGDESLQTQKFLSSTVNNFNDLRQSRKAQINQNESLGSCFSIQKQRCLTDV